MTIHASNPFPADDDVVRRLRGRLGGAVTLICGGGAGLTVSSLMIANGRPARLHFLMDPESELADEVSVGSALTCSLLEWGQRDLAEVFAGRLPAPGGVFAQAEFVADQAGRRPAGVTTYAEMQVVDLRQSGWSVEVTCELTRVVIGHEARPLAHRRGRYQSATPEPGAPDE